MPLRGRGFTHVISHTSDETLHHVSLDAPRTEERSRRRAVVAKIADRAHYWMSEQSYAEQRASVDNDSTCPSQNVTITMPSWHSEYRVSRIVFAERIVGERLAMSVAERDVHNLRVNLRQGRE